MRVAIVASPRNTPQAAEGDLSKENPVAAGQKHDLPGISRLAQIVLSYLQLDRTAEGSREPPARAVAEPRDREHGQHAEGACVLQLPRVLQDPLRSGIGLNGLSIPTI